MRSLVTLAACSILMAAATAQPPLRERGPTAAPAAPPTGAYADPRWQPPGPLPSRWRLGVRVQNTDAGCLVSQVEPNSAAARAGIEPNDRILCVDGYQVGVVNGVLYDVADECARRADAQGRVRLLVQNGRNGQFLTLPVQLAAWSSGRVSGALSMDQPAYLSANAYAVVKLVEQPRWGGRATVLSEERFRWPGRFPMAYELSYNPGEFTPDRRYGLTAEVMDQGRLVAQTRGMADFKPGPRIDLMVFLAGSPTPPVPPQPGPWWPANPSAEIRGWYRRYFGHDPSPARLQHIANQMVDGRTIRDIRILMLASTEYFEDCGGDSRRFLARSFEAVRGRAPTREEIERMHRRFEQLGGNRPTYIRDLFDASGVR